MKRIGPYAHAPIRGNIELPLSKSVCNRSLIIAALADLNLDEIPLSEAMDSQVMKQAIRTESAFIDLGLAGTAFRFLTAYFALVGNEEEVVLSGNARMKERPVGPLVKALRELGAQIDYVDKEGFPPLRIRPSRLENRSVIYIKGNESSQFISALLMIGPYVQGGLDLFLQPPVYSYSYVHLTLEMMRRMGARIEQEGSFFRVKESSYKKQQAVVERDWTNASYWYSLLAMSDGGELSFPGLVVESLQGDRACATLFEHFGVNTVPLRNSTIIKLDKPEHPEELVLDLKSNPDLAQTFVVTALGVGIPVFISGIQNLRIKETDRLQALKNELEKFGAFVELGEDFIKMLPPVSLKSDIWLETYGDHRMAMAFAPLALKTNLKIQDPQVVEKSYPKFWSEFDRLLGVTQESTDQAD